MNKPLVGTEFDFRYRFWIIGAFFCTGFSLYRFDQLNIVQYAIDRAVRDDSPRAAILAQATFALSALRVLCAAVIRTGQRLICGRTSRRIPVCTPKLLSPTDLIATCAILYISAACYSH
jgi:hypothetical protein